MIRSRPRETAVAPGGLGFRMPAEWAPHEATWIAWPHNRTDWPGKLTPIQWVYSEIVRKITPGEIVRILVNSKTHTDRARHILQRAGVNFSRVQFHRVPTNRGWTRDYGPIFVRREARSEVSGQGPGGGGQRSRDRGEVAIVRFRFNAWAKYPDWRLDDRVAERAARALGFRTFRARVNDCHVVLEGGSIEVNGRGTLITTEECLLDQATQVRNPDLSKSDLELVMKDYLGVSNVLWLGRGIAGDDTHGHVDDICRFVGPRTVVLCREADPGEINYRPLEENRERLQGMRLEDGSKIQVIDVPMPVPLYLDGRRLPASYANFYISNAAVLVPTFNDPMDRMALGTLAELFTDRPVVGIHAVDLAWGLGTLHCLTQQQPSL